MLVVHLSPSLLAEGCLLARNTCRSVICLRELVPLSLERTYEATLHGLVDPTISVALEWALRPHLVPRVSGSCLHGPRPGLVLGVCWPPVLFVLCVHWLPVALGVQSSGGHLCHALLHPSDCTPAPDKAPTLPA